MHWDFGGVHRVEQEACTGTCAVARELAHQRLAKRMPLRAAQACAQTVYGRPAAGRQDVREEDERTRTHTVNTKKCLQFNYLLYPRPAL